MRLFVIAMAFVLVGCDSPRGGTGNAGGGDDWLISQAGEAGVKIDNRGRITYLDLSNKAIANADLAAIAKHTQLRELYLAKTGVSDEGLAHLRPLTQLRIISLADTQVTDVALKHLAVIRSLRQIFLYPSKVTDAGVAELKAALPGVQVRY
ncbi:MAG: hypothetical protein ACKVKM_08110 [Verrucomicrobiia bacterium]